MSNDFHQTSLMTTDSAKFDQKRNIHPCAMSLRQSDLNNIRRITMWTKPAATEMRFGFEVTMYVMNK